MIIGVVGAIGSGKSLFSRRLNSEGFNRLSFSDTIREVARIRGLEINRKNLQDLGDEIRRQEGTGAWAKRLIEQMSKDEDYVIDGFRNPGEIEEFKKLKDFNLVFIDSPSEERKKRLINRGREDDPKTEVSFREFDERDRGLGQDEHGQQNSRCFEMADRKIVNDCSFKEFNDYIGKLVEEMRRNP